MISFVGLESWSTQKDFNSMHYFPRRYFYGSYKFFRKYKYDSFRFLYSQKMCQAAYTTCRFLSYSLELFLHYRNKYNQAQV